MKREDEITKSLNHTMMSKEIIIERYSDGKDY